MENLYSHNFREVFFIKTFFKILVTFLLLVVILLFTFNINDSVSFNKGEIASENPQIDYRAPFEAIPDTIYVREGQTVNVGDTLITLISEEVRREYENAKATYTSLSKTRETILQLIKAANEKIINLKEDRQLTKRLFAVEKERMVNELMAASEKAELSRKKAEEVGFAKLKIDSTLFQEEVISKLDMTNSFDTYLGYQDQLVDARQMVTRMSGNLKNLDNSFLKSQNATDLRLIQLGEEVKDLDKQSADNDKELENALENLNYAHQEVEDQYIISEISGRVSNLYNLKYTQNFVDKGAVLVSVVPEKDKFYARVLIPQSDIRYVRVGQQAHLKVDAFNYFEEGVIHGVVSYVPERKPREDFFVTIDIVSKPNFPLKAGYSLRGEVLIEQLKIYRFILKKLFRRLQ